MADHTDLLAAPMMQMIWIPCFAFGKDSPNIVPASAPKGEMKWKHFHILAYEEDVNGLQVERVEVWHGIRAFLACVHASIQHDGLSFVLYDVTRSANLLTASKPGKEKFI